MFSQDSQPNLSGIDLAEAGSNAGTQLAARFCANHDSL
jgi:hypothetical protein